MPSMPGIIRSERSRSNSPSREHVQPLGGVRRSLHLEPLFSERVAQGPHQFDLVVHDEQAAARVCDWHGILPVGLVRSQVVSAARRHSCPVRTGRVTRTVVPSPDRLSISRVPWCCRTIRRQMARPRPVPFPSSLVVKNGSVTRLRCSGGMPSRCPPPRSRRRGAGRGVRRSRTRRASRPPFGMASAALVNRFRNTCRRCWRSA